MSANPPDPMTTPKMRERPKMIGRCVVCETPVMSDEPHTLVRGDCSEVGEGNALHAICCDIWNAARAALGEGA